MLFRKGFICKEHSILAIAELAPQIMGIMNDLLETVKKEAGDDLLIQPNNFIKSALKRGLNPLELAPWLTQKDIVQYHPSVPDIWHQKLMQENIDKIFNPGVPNVKRSELPKIVLGEIHGLPRQVEELDD